MSRKVAFTSKIGQGAYILCLHSSSGSSRQWQLLQEKLADDYTVVAPDLYGYGQSPDWRESRTMRLDDEIDLLTTVIDAIPCPFHLIGHSYGGAVAFKLALANPRKIRSLVVYEPVLFNILLESGDNDGAKEITAVQDDINRAIIDGRLDDAAGRFVDYWSGSGAWDQLSDRHREAVKRRMNKVREDFQATFGDRTSLKSFSEFKVPTLFLYGLQSPRATISIAEKILPHLPRAEARGLLSLGHMGPVTHAEYVNDLIANFLKHQPRGILLHQITGTS